MILSELIARLEDSLEDWGDCEVRLATQPNWPMAHEVAGVHVVEPERMDEPCPDHDREDCAECSDEPMVAWLVEGEQCDDPYAPKMAWASL